MALLSRLSLSSCCLQPRHAWEKLLELQAAAVAAAAAAVAAIGIAPLPWLVRMLIKAGPNAFRKQI